MKTKLLKKFRKQYVITRENNKWLIGVKNGDYNKFNNTFDAVLFMFNHIW